MLRDGEAHRGDAAGAGLRRRARCASRTPWRRCELTSDPPGARIFLNGEARGVTPAQIDGICSGPAPRRGQARRRASSSRTCRSGKDEAVSLDCPIRPTLALPRRRGGRRRAASATSRRPRRRSSRTWRSSARSTSSPRRARPSTASSSRRRRRRPALAARRGRRARPRAQGDRAAGRGARGPGLPDRGAARGAAAAHGAAVPARRRQHDRRGARGRLRGERLLRRRARAPGRDASRAGGPGAGSSRWTRCCTRACPCCGSCRAARRSRPACSPGDVLLSLDGQAVKRTAELLAAVAAKKPGDKLIALQAAGRGVGSVPRVVELVLGETRARDPADTTRSSSTTRR